MLATQCLVQRRPKTMRISYSGELGNGVTAKDLILATIGRLGTGGMVGHAVEYAGETIRGLSMENRMTICNMTIEGGGRAGMIAPDETTFEWVEGRPGAPTDFEAAVARWRELPTEDGAELRHRGRGRRRRRCRRWSPGGRTRARWSRSPARSPSRDPRPRSARCATWTSSRGARSGRSSSTASSSARARTRGSATCARRRRWSRAARSRARSSAMVVPGSAQVKAEAEAEGLDEVFRAAGFDWRSGRAARCAWG